MLEEHARPAGQVSRRFSAEYYDTANRPHPLVEELQALVQYRELVKQFVARSLKTRYKRSVLGIVWTMLNPLLTMLVLSVVFSQVIRFPNQNYPYPVYVLAGLTVWRFFSFGTSGAMGEMLWSGQLLSRIYVPKSVFPVSSVLTALVDLAIALIPLFLISLVLGVPLRPAMLVMPLAVLLLALFTLGMGLLLATAAVYFADMLPVYEVALTIWMYATPIIYPLETVPAPFQPFLKLNPLYYMVELFRLPLLEGRLPDLGTWLIAAALAIVALALGGYIFTAKSNEYAYRI